ncbi:vitamin K epoxide reductase family protein [Pedobacter sp. KACC 23697]|uniref:Vitamin K epoxide reductase family protein n=1 Tax=Pedobacter sp. KACC 23697 TaxID=3149230 RepID=A0AAU7K6V0_9SPHI
MLAVSDCLDEWRIENATYRIGKDEYDPTLLEYPLLAYMPKKDFIVIEAIEDGMVTYSDAKQISAKIAESDFLEQWNGIFLHAEAGAESGPRLELKNLSNRYLNSLGLPMLMVLIFGAVLSIFLTQHRPAEALIPVLIKLAGLAISTLLLIHTVNGNNTLANSLCKLGGKTNCNKILNSSAARINSWLSWSEVGFFYFSGSLIALLVSSFYIHFLAILNLLCLPYTVWSIGYQYFNKNWCILCCCVQGLLGAEFFYFLFAFEYSIPVLSSADVIILALAFLFPVSIWFSLKPVFSDWIKLEPLRTQLKTFKYNKELFHQILSKQPCYAVDHTLYPIELGSKEPKNIITVISNPFCEPCAAAHRVMEDLLYYNSDLQFKLVFATSAEEDDPAVKFQQHVTTIAYSDQGDHVQKALEDWYKDPKRKYDSWSVRFPIGTIPGTEDIPFRQKAWCDMVGVILTPTILVNGYKLPDPYRVEDLRYLISG